MPLSGARYANRIDGKETIMPRRVLLAVCAAAVAVCAHATNYTDIWWNPAEPGWGVNLAQSDNFIFATFFVYGPGNVPTWYAGNLTLDASGAYTGGLYATTGTYFGTVPYNPGQFVPTQVGTATFRPTAADKGSLTYNVASVPVTKNIQRQALTPISLAGSFTGGVAVLDSACANPADNGATNIGVNITIMKPASGPFTLVFDVPGFGSCNLTSTGTVTQNGQLHSFAGTLACPGDPPVALTVSELRTTSLGIEGRWTAANAGGCHEEGRFGGVVVY